MCADHVRRRRAIYTVLHVSTCLCVCIITVGGYSDCVYRKHTQYTHTHIANVFLERPARGGKTICTITTALRTSPVDGEMKLSTQLLERDRLDLGHSLNGKRYAES